MSLGQLCGLHTVGLLAWTIGYVVNRYGHSVSDETASGEVPLLLWLLCGLPNRKNRVTARGLALQLGGLAYESVVVVATLSGIPGTTAFQLGFWTLLVSMYLATAWFRYAKGDR